MSCAVAVDQRHVLPRLPQVMGGPRAEYAGAITATSYIRFCGGIAAVTDC